MRRKGRFPIPCVPAGCGQRGPFSHVREWPPLDPPREREGSPPQPPTLAVSILKSCTRCAIRCGVHGFAMNLLRVVTCCSSALLREARVTLPRRQTACRMRHCCARRIEECRGRRILVCTPTRSAERQRIIEAEANRIAMLNAALPRAGIPIPEAKGLFKPETANQTPFFWTVTPPVFFLGKENGGCGLAARRRHIPPRCARKILCSCYRRNLIFPQD